LMNIYHFILNVTVRQIAFHDEIFGKPKIRRETNEGKK
jgi:hypothetical protein